MKKKFLILGGAGFIGSNFVEYLKLKKIQFKIVDNLLEGSDYIFYKKNKVHIYKKDASNFNFLKNIILKVNPDYLVNFAAQSHVDRSIKNPENFIFNNLKITYNILEIKRKLNFNFKFINISTDEVYGSIKKGFFTEKSSLLPNSPYSMSKTSSDLLCRSYYETYGIKTLTLRLCNNYGYRQHDEKYIPTILRKLKKNQKIPIYGDGKNRREWMFVEDSVKIIYNLSQKASNDIINISSCFEIDNLQLAKKIILKYHNTNNFMKYIKFVKDRPGHDLRYSLRSNKLKKIIGNYKFISLDEGLLRTINWYKKNR